MAGILMPLIFPIGFFQDYAVPYQGLARAQEMLSCADQNSETQGAFCTRWWCGHCRLPLFHS